MVQLPEYPAQLVNRNNRGTISLDTFNKIRQMKRILLGNVPVVSRIDDEAMEEIQEYLSPGNEEEVVTELIERKFTWIINMGSNITWIFHGVGSLNTDWSKHDDNEKDWRANPLVSEFVADVCYEMFQLLLRNPEAHRNAKTCNHLFCSFWPYAVWAYKQILDKNLEEKPEWNSNLERMTKAIWSSYTPQNYANTNNNNDVFKRAFTAFVAGDKSWAGMMTDAGVNQILDKFRTVAFNAMKKTNTPMPGASVLYYDLSTVYDKRDLDSSLVPIEGSPMSIDDQLLMKTEIESDMWRAETSLLVPMGIYDNHVESLSYLDKVCQGFFK